MNILNKLTIKHLKMNKKRTIVTIIGVILSTALMVGIGLLFATVRDNTLKMTIEDSGSHHVKVETLSSNLDKIKSFDDIKSYDYYYNIGYALYDKVSYIKVISKDNINKELSKGSLPSNSKEIIVPESFGDYLGKTINIGDTIKLNVGELNDNEEVLNSKPYEFKIVGLYKGNYNSEIGVDVYTKDLKSEKMTVLITYDNVKKVYSKTEELGETLGLKNICKTGVCYKEVEYNDALLSLYGVSKYNNFLSSVTSIIVIILALVSVGCVTVIYNSFAISVMERKKQFGLFSSIGATKTQLMKTVFFEAFIIGLIGIPIGILSGIFGIWVVLIIINNLLPDVFSFPLALSIYPLFMYIPIIFMIITVFISALIPSFMASRVSPIEAIRQNNDIKIHKGKIKTPKFIRKLFGIEGELALKNIKRNNKKYRITIVSLFISIVLFISFSGFTNYGIKTVYRYTELPKFDIMVDISKVDKDVDFDKMTNDIINNSDVKKYTIEDMKMLFVKRVNKSHYNQEFYDKFISDGNDEYTQVNLHIIDDSAYNSYKKDLGLKEDRIILLNNFRNINYEDSKRTAKEYKIFEDTKFNSDLYLMSINDNSVNYNNVNKNLNNLYLTDKLPFGLDFAVSTGYYGSLHIVISKSMEDSLGLTSILGEVEDRHIYLKANPYKNIDKLLTEYNDNKESNSSFMFVNVPKEMKLISNVLLALKLLLYGFITLVTLIGVTSVFNTINTSIALRRKEFAMLRSIGLSPKGFNKILYFESFFFGLKSLVYAIPCSIGVLYLLHKAFGTMVEFTSLMIPWVSILEAIVGVFIIVLMSMKYASSKIKKENILDAIREENI